MCFFRNVGRHVGKAAPAWRGNCPAKASAEIKAGRARGGESTLYVDRVRGTHVSIFPDGIVRREITVDVRCLRLQRTDVKRQHKA